ncbi:hypothetical protein [Methanobrevibacter sp.]|uniref:hypothetical protein n=1 Tax=Methanobrevibacter sp. TaxID=66852 RepID=UPI0025DCBE46|nr:hypothetical protein [Methanobrevibacter sp.]MBQ2832147.1 hypothetical protein [Methanobrevibacter sp.]
MENKKIIIIAVAIIAVIAVVGVIFATGILNGNKQVTEFETDFMNGTFVGNVSLVNDSLGYLHSYKDKQHNITYNVTTIDNSSALMEIYELQGVTNPDERTFNGNEWKIYFSEAIPSEDLNSTANNTMNIIICECQGENQGYLIFAIFEADSDVNSTGNAFGEAYTDYIEPLLKSITLKKSDDVPLISEQYGLSEQEFAHQMELIRQYKSGNYSS